MAKQQTEQKQKTDKASQKKNAAAPAANAEAKLDPAQARDRLTATGRNDACPCGSGKKYKKCHLATDEQSAAPSPVAPDAKELLTNAWRLFEQRRPGAAEKEFRAALAVDGELMDARVGIGMARLSAGNTEGAKEELGAVLTATEDKAEAVRKSAGDKPKDGFSQPEVQPYIRAAHALGCLAYDEEHYDEAVKELSRVHSIDDGNVGIEARLIAAKSLMKLEKPGDAAALLEPVEKLEAAGSRVPLGLALARFASGDEAGARKSLDTALEANPHYGKTLLGRIRRRVENIAGAQPGSVEEALLYTQTYGDVWNDAAKKFLEEVMDARAAARKPATEPAEEPAEEASP
jgi:tetratricopeptide (TPR) repeat protein